MMILTTPAKLAAPTKMRLTTSPQPGHDISHLRSVPASWCLLGKESESLRSLG